MVFAHTFEKEFEQQNKVTKGAFFATESYEIIAEQCVEVIDTPAKQTAELIEKIRKSFLAIDKTTENNPILIGAIPFDTDKPSSLNLYSNYLKSARVNSNAGKDKTDQFTIGEKNQLIPEGLFKSNVDKALQHFDNKLIEKIVLSQSVEVELNSTLTAPALFEKLKIKNPNAYSFSIPVDANKHLIGASPELLLSKHQQNVNSNPLAGSDKRSQSKVENIEKIKRLESSPKDNHEHRFVVENIARNLVPYCKSLQISEYPCVLETSNMLHLSSSLSGQLRSPSPTALELALKLHPTPAVCGTPTDVAKQFILDNEGYDREFYTGLVGWMDSEGNGEWVVTIRCGVLADNILKLYAGAGIVQGSDPDSEWQETQAKLNTMLNVFND